MSELWSRRNVIATISIGSLSIAMTAGIFFYGNLSQKVSSPAVEMPKSSESVDASEILPSILVSSIHVSEVPMDIPAVFEIGIQTGGLSDLVASDIDVILDFGRAEIEICDHTPKSAIKNVVAKEKHRLHMVIAEMRKKEKLYIRCLISSPVFDQVIIQGGNIRSGTSMDFEQYQASLLSEPLGFWGGLVRFFVILGVVVICIWVIKWMLDWD